MKFNDSLIESQNTTKQMQTIHGSSKNPFFFSKTFKIEMENATK